MKRFHFTLRIKLVVYFILGFVIPIVIFGILLFALQQRNSQRFMVRSQETSALQLADHISRELRSIQSLSNLYYLDNALVKSLIKGTEGAEELYQKSRELSRTYSSVLKNIQVDIAVLDSDGICRNCNPDSVHPNAAVLNDLVRRQGNLSWFTPYHFKNRVGNDIALYAYRPLHDRNTWQQVGALLITLKESELLKIYSGYLSESQNAYLIDDQGRIVSWVDNQSVTYDIPNKILPLYSGTFQDRAEGIPQLVSFYSLQTAGLKLVIASDLNVLRGAYRQTTFLFLEILVLYVLLALCATYILPKSFVRPIHELQKNIDLVKQGNLDVMVPVTSSDEIGELSERYNEMLRRLQEVLSELMSAQQAQHQAEMNALQAQINPHFIYNSLASIRFLIISKQNTEADQALVALISILRGTLSNPHEFSTVGQELKLLQDYIALNRISFSRPLRVELHADESIRNCRLCKLMLQPIVENSFIHGFFGRENRKECILWISALDRDDHVEITLRDNGCGFDPNAPAPPEDTSCIPGSGLGMANIHERLQLAFGPEYGLRVESILGVGTTVIVTIPKQQPQGGAFVYDNFDSR